MSNNPVADKITQALAALRRAGIKGYRRVAAGKMLPGPGVGFTRDHENWAYKRGVLYLSYGPGEPLRSVDAISEYGIGVLDTLRAAGFEASREHPHACIALVVDPVLAQEVPRG